MREVLNHGGHRVWLCGEAIARLSGRDRARAIAYVPQRTPEGFPVSVFDAVLLGRTPHMGRRPTPQDIRLTEAMLNRLRLDDLAFRSVAELSGGERQRVTLARALVQDTPLIILDELRGP